MRASLITSVLVFLCTVARVDAATITLDFEGFADLTTLTTQYSGATFANTTILTSGVSLNDVDFPPHSGVNAVFDDGGPLSLSFTSPVAGFQGFLTYTSPLTLRAFDSSLTLLGSTTSAFSNNLSLGGDLGSSPNELLAIAFPNISRITITGAPEGASFVLDDVTYTTAAASGPPSAIPEPSTLTLLALGCAGLMRRRRTPAKPFHQSTA